MVRVIDHYRQRFSRDVLPTIRPNVSITNRPSSQNINIQYSPASTSHLHAHCR